MKEIFSKLYLQTFNIKIFIQIMQIVFRYKVCYVSLQSQSQSHKIY